MKLNEVLGTQKTGAGYASLSLDNESTQKIHEVLKELGITDYITDLHITLVYDRSNPVIDMNVNTIKKYSAGITSADTLGDMSSKWGAIALKLDAPSIVVRHKDYIDAGFTHSYPEFVPHLSLKYRPSETDIKTIKDNVDKFKQLKLDFTNEKLEKIKED